MVKKIDYEREIFDKIIAYRDDPCGFMVNILDVKSEHLWSKMRQVAESVRDNQLTAVPAGHDVSKTYTAGRIVIWFKACFQPSTVITTAPSDNQVRNQLWREIRTAITSAKVNLGGKPTSVMWDVKPSQQTLTLLKPEQRGLWEKNFAIGFSTSPDTISEHATKMQGWHNDWILVVLDEAGGIMPQIWQTIMDSLIVNERCKVLAIGNPTDPYGDFADVCKEGSGWNVIPISVKDTPNYREGREIIPGVAGRDYEAGIIKSHGLNSNEHKYRCLGQFPEYSEGTFYGQFISELERKGGIGDYPYDPTALVYTFGDYGDIYTAVLFVQFIRENIRLIDYFYDDTGMGIPAMCKVFDSKPYVYAKLQGHWGGPDLDPVSGSNRKSLATGRTIISEFAKLGYHMNCCVKHYFDDGINDARGIWPLCRIDKKWCSEFIEAVKKYKKRKNLQYSTDELPAYYDEPEPTPCRHPADAFRHLAVVYRQQLVIDNRRIGFTSVTRLGDSPTVKSDPYRNWNVLIGSKMRRRNKGII